MFSKLKEMQVKSQEKYQQSLSKAEEQMNQQYQKEIDGLLLEGEEVIQTYGLVIDFACITDRRLFFVDGNMTNKKKKVVSIPIHHIHSVSYDMGYVMGEVTITTSHMEYEVKVLNKDLAKRFANHLLSLICN
jgi:hypothetical protein